MLNMLLQHPKIDEYELDSLRSIGYGAAAMPVEVLRAAIERFGPIVYSGFGMTELGGNVLTFPKPAHVRAVNGEEHLLAVVRHADVPRRRAGRRRGHGASARPAWSARSSSRASRC